MSGHVVHLERYPVAREHLLYSLLHPIREIAAPQRPDREGSGYRSGAFELGDHRRSEHHHKLACSRGEFLREHPPWTERVLWNSMVSLT